MVTAGYLRHHGDVVGGVAEALSVSMPSQTGGTRAVTLRPMPAVPELGVLPELPGRVVFYDDFSGYPVGSVPSDPPWRFFDGDPVVSNGVLTVEQDVETSGRVGNVLRVRSDYGDGAELHRPVVYTALPGGVPASRDWDDYHAGFRVRLANTIYNDGALVLLRKGDGRFYAPYILNNPSARVSLYLRKVMGWRGEVLGAPWRGEAPGVLLAQRDVDVSLERGWHKFVISLTGASIRLWHDRNPILTVEHDEPSMRYGTVVLGGIGTGSTVHWARWEALPRESRESFPPLCPDAVFEVRSASNTVAELREKMRSYLANGAQLAVLIDPEGQAVEVYRPGRQVDRYQQAARVALEPELLRFSLELAPGSRRPN